MARNNLIVLVAVLATAAARTASPVPCKCSQPLNCTIPPSGGLLDSQALLQRVHEQCPELPFTHAQLHPHVHEAIIGPAVVVGIGALVRHTLLHTGLPLPYTVVLLVIGFAIGALLQWSVVSPLEKTLETCEMPTLFWSDQLQRSFTTLAALDPHLLLHIFIPPLIYESASAIEWHVFFQLKCVSHAAHAHTAHAHNNL